MNVLMGKNVDSVWERWIRPGNWGSALMGTWELKIRRRSVEEDIERRWEGMKTGAGGTQEGNWNQEESEGPWFPYALTLYPI